MRWLVVLALAGCYAPQAAEGAPCTTNDQCPSPQRCVMGTCSLGGGDPADAPPGGGDAVLADASPDALALGCGASGNVCGGGGLSIGSCGSRCWLMCAGVRTYAEGVALCAAWQGTLAEIDNATEQACAVDRVTGKTWIGLSQTPGTPTVDKGWSWGGTRPLGFESWQIGAPNDGDGIENGGEQCGHMQDGGTWDDEDCKVPRSILCERPASP